MQWISTLAVQSTRSNRELNLINPTLGGRSGQCERLMKLKEAPVDGIILAEVIIDMIPQMSAIAKPTTWGILSGILLSTKPNCRRYRGTY